MFSSFKALLTVILIVGGICAAPLSAASPGWQSHAGDHDFAPPPEEGVSLTSHLERIRLAWSTRLHTGFGKGGSGSALSALEEGFEPAYGEMASPILSDGVLLVSWSQPTGTVTTDLSKLKHRYYDDDDKNRKLLDTYFRIDADWKTVALDAETGEILWERTEPSASLNFLSNKRDHNGITGAARDGLYVTMTMLGHVYAYDVKSGKTRWSFTLEEWNPRAQAVKEESLANRRITSLDEGPFGHKRTGAMIIGQVALLPDLQGGLLGVDVDSGKIRWQAPWRLHDQATPRTWTHDGKTWVVGHYASDKGGAVHLLDPETGVTKWSHSTGVNPGQLLMGDGHILLNKEPRTGKTNFLTCYRITPDGLEERWSFEETTKNAVELKADFGAHRKGVIRDGVLYIKLGAGKGVRARMAAVDLESGRELNAVEDPDLGLNAGQPFLAEDKLFVQKNSAHSGSKAGLYVYQIGQDGRLSYLGDVMYKGLGISLMTAYQYPIEYPYADGKLYLRGKRQIVAIDLREVENRMADMKLHGLWAGFHRPVEAVLIADENGKVEQGRLDSPPRRELGVVGTSAHRNDGWTPLVFSEPIAIGNAVETSAEFRFVAFSSQGRLEMNEADGTDWTGTWYRDYPGWKETVKREGDLHETSEGGYDRRGWPTGWLKDRPVTFFSDLPEGQERVFLQLHGFTPRVPEGKGPRNMTLCLDHDGKTVTAGVGGGFQFNQAYHEVDGSGLEVDEKGIRGTAWVYLNSDNWVPGDYQNGGSLAGRVELDIRFGEPNQQGIYPVTGSWEAEWGIPHTRSGEVLAVLNPAP